MRGRIATCLALFALALVLPAATPVSAGAASAQDRYSLAGGCFALRAASTGRYVSEGSGAYNASASSTGAAEPFRMQATALGRYLFYGRARDFMGTTPQGRVQSAAKPDQASDWRVDQVEGGNFTVTLQSSGRALAVGGDGRLTLADPGRGSRFGFAPARGCAVFPEVDTSVSGAPSKGSTPFTEVAGFVDAHMHMMAFEFLGGRAHCGRPWSPYGVTVALTDCPDHYPNGGGAILEDAVSSGAPGPTHDPVGWPTFKDWPHHASLTHEQSYYKWVERAWRAGLRTYVNLLVENKVLCEVYPYKKNSCNEMDAVRLQARRLRELEDYIDAQAGGPGKGFFRIVTDPFQARRVANAGKLAVVMGIEVSEPFDCRVYNDQPKCDRAQIDRGLDEVYRLGVRDMEIINKFDNALAGVAGDSGVTGPTVNSGNRLETGKYWQMQTCTGRPGETDLEQPTPFSHNDDSVISNGLQSILPAGLTPVYPRGAHCNARGLTDLGEHLIRRMMAKRMVVDPDHLDVRSREAVLSLLESKRYSGAVSSHSWSTPGTLPRIYRLGGIVTPYAGNSTSFVQAWRDSKPQRDPRFFYGFGYGADMNGFGEQGEPRTGAPNPVRYPFKSFDGKQTIHRQRSGERVYDINKDGVAHYGLYPDWIEDLRKIAGDGIVKDMSRGSEAYIQMWERAVGVPREACRSSRGRFTSRGLGRQRLGVTSEQLLRRAGQPARRKNRAWRYCVERRLGRGAKVLTVFTRGGRVALLASTARGHRTITRGGVRIGPGTRASRLRGRARRVGRGLYARPAGRGARFVYRVRRGRVSYVAVASRTAARNRITLRRYLRLAGLR